MTLTTMSSQMVIQKPIYSSSDSLFKILPPAIGGLFYGVSSRSGLGRASNMRSENKNLNLETDKFASTPPFSKKHLTGVILHLTFGRNFSKTIWWELFQKAFSGNF
jgi:hypothetical protein